MFFLFKSFSLFLVNLSYYSVYLFSVCQIYLYKILKESNNIIDSNLELLNIKKKFMELFKNKISSIEFIKNGIVYNEIINDFDFILYSDNNNGNNNIINRVMVNNSTNIPNKYELSNIKFFTLELKIGEKLSYIIDFNKNDNYYIVGNEFNYKFFKYLINKTSGIVNNIDNEKVILNILDNNVNNIEIELNPKGQSILIQKNSYQILN